MRPPDASRGVVLLLMQVGAGCLTSCARPRRALLPIRSASPVQRDNNIMVMVGISSWGRGTARASLLPRNRCTASLALNRRHQDFLLAQAAAFRAAALAAAVEAGSVGPDSSPEASRVTHACSGGFVVATHSTHPDRAPAAEILPQPRAWGFAHAHEASRSPSFRSPRAGGT